MNGSNAKIIDFEKMRKLKEMGTSIVPETIEEMDENYRLLRKVMMEIAREPQNQRLERRIMELEGDNKMMKNKLENSFPTHIVSYMVLCSIIFGVSTTLLILRFVFRIYVVDPYYLICALIISITLFGTAVLAIKDWKCFLNEK